MGAIYDTAQSILDFARGCVADCAVYERQFVTYGRPTIDCDTLAVAIGGSDVISISNECAIHSTTFTVTVARCCWPVTNNDGTPPSGDAIDTATSCLSADVEALLCCLGSIILTGDGIVGRCRPKITGTRVNNPTGGCASIEISMTIQTKPCCDA